MRAEQQSFFDQYGSEAKQILDELLDKYTEHGTAQFLIPEVLELPPINAHGNVIEIAANFGGVETAAASSGSASDLAVRGCMNAIGGLSDESGCTPRTIKVRPLTTMAKKTAKKAEQPKTTRRSWEPSSSPRATLCARTRGSTGDLDRLPCSPGSCSSKFLDDREKVEEARAGIGGKKYKPALADPYRWRDWATNKQGITGDELIAFVNQDEATRAGRPTGARFACLLAQPAIHERRPPTGCDRDRVRRRC